MIFCKGQFFSNSDGECLIEHRGLLPLEKNMILVPVIFSYYDHFLLGASSGLRSRS